MDHEKSNEKEQQGALQEFCTNPPDEMEFEENATHFSRWLRSKDFDPETAQKLWAMYSGTRELFSIDNNSRNDEIPEVLLTHGFTDFLGFDKEGAAVRLYTCGRTDAEGYFRTIPGIQLRLYCIQEMENDIRRMKEENRRTGRSVDKTLHLVDMEGFNPKQCFQKYILEGGLDMVKCFREFYPRISKGFVIFNAPIYIYILLKLFKPILKSEMIKRMKIIHGDSWKNYLLTRIDANVLPKMLGGTSDISVSLGGKIPEEQYAMNQPRLEETDNGVKCVTIQPRATFTLRKIVAKHNSIILLEFRSENASLEFCVFYKRFEAVDDQIASSDDGQLPDVELSGFVRICFACRLQCHLAPEKQKLHCRQPGIYAFSFDNSRSLLWTNKLVYRATLLETQGP